MKKNFVIFLFLFSILLCPFKTASAENENVLKDLQVIMQVKDDGYIQVTQNMRLQMQKDKPFIIPLHNSFDMHAGDGINRHFAAPVENIRVEGIDYNLDETQKDITEILLLGADGDRDVKLNYDIKPPEDTFETMDFLYRDIIWGDQDYIIENFSAKVALPSTFDTKELNVMRGSDEGVKENGASVSTENQSIIISAQNIVPGEWLTTSLILPEGYFTAGNTTVFEQVGQNFDIDHYKVHATVNEKNTVHVEEEITVRYYTPQHGIYRDIPTFYSMSWKENGIQKKANYRIPVENISVDGMQYKITNENNFTRIMMGNENDLVDGTQTYRMRYDLPIGDDRLKSRDFVYFNLTGNGWPAAINQAQFEITLPKPFDEKNICFYTGLQGETKNDVAFFVQGNTVYAKTTKQLLNYEGVTVDIGLPEEYFKVPASTDPLFYIGICFIVLFVFGLFIYLLFGKNKRVVPTVEFLPPEGLNPAETGYIYKGFADNRDILALILHWVAKGYVTLTGDKKAFRLIKEKEFKEKDFAQTRLFSGLFSHSSSVTQSSGLDIRSLFETAKADTVSGLISRLHENIMDTYSSRWQKIMMFICPLPILLFFGYLSYATGSTFLLSIIIALIQGFISFFCVHFLANTYRKWRSINSIKKTTRLALLFIIFAWFIGCTLIIGSETETLLYFIASMVCFLFLAVFALNMKKRTEKGSELLGKIIGFRNFIKTAEKDKIKRLVKDDPRIFYSILPYAYTLDVTKEWVRQFEGIYNIEGVKENAASDIMNSIAFYQSVEAALESMNTAISHNYAGETYGSDGGVSGGSAGLGGGSSGGGFGGGGGGSW